MTDGSEPLIRIHDARNSDNDLDDLAAHCLNARRAANRLGLAVERHLLDMALLEVARKISVAAGSDRCDGN